MKTQLKATYAQRRSGYIVTTSLHLHYAGVRAEFRGADGQIVYHATESGMKKLQRDFDVVIRSMALATK